MITQIEDSLKEIEEHMENINNMLPGLPDDYAEDFLMQVQTASASLEEAHSYLLEKRHVHKDQYRKEN